MPPPDYVNGDSSGDAPRLSRRAFLRYAAFLPPLIGEGFFSGGLTPTLTLPRPAQIAGQGRELAPSWPEAALSHAQALSTLRAYLVRTKLTKFAASFRTLLTETARSCVRADRQWIVPSRAYGQWFFPRDSFWVLAALGDAALAAMTVARFAAYQKRTADGHVATALHVSSAAGAGNLTVNASAGRDDESTLYFILHSYLLKRLGGIPDKAALQRAHGFIAARAGEGRYVTHGETRVGDGRDGLAEIGTYHYWADTYRPAGRPSATPQVFAHNQGLLCVALRALESMGVSTAPGLRARAERAYAEMVNPMDGASLPQREGSTVVDVSALAGEALSLYWFDAPLLPATRVGATLARFAKVRYTDGRFLGYKVISDFGGGYRSPFEFRGSPQNLPGNYQNGASWLLWDALALYCGVRHGVTDAKELLVARLQSEVRRDWASHEFLITHPVALGVGDAFRSGYGWNAFVARLLPA